MQLQTFYLFISDFVIQKTNEILYGVQEDMVHISLELASIDICKVFL